MRANFLALILILQQLSEVLLEDIVINSTIRLNWTSQTFIIPVESQLGYPWTICRKFSDVYCLDNYETRELDTEPAFHAFVNLRTSASMHTSYYWLEYNAITKTEHLFRPFYRRHNFFVDRESCCLGQFYQYFAEAFKKMLLTPKKYIEELADYSEENKNLNAIWAFFEPVCRVNIITKLGFGKGDLQRFNNNPNIAPQRDGTPYLLKLGKKWSTDIPYDNPGHYLTFHWFKWNVICLEQAWICYGM